MTPEAWIAVVTTAIGLAAAGIAKLWKIGDDTGYTRRTIEQLGIDAAANAARIGELEATCDQHDRRLVRLETLVPTPRAAP